VEEGEVEAGSPVEIVHRDPGRVSVNDINHLYYGTSRSAELLQRAVNLEALPASWRDYLRERGAARVSTR
jgi:MOSC domain-containing protein YiiM